MDSRIWVLFNGTPITDLDLLVNTTADASYAFSISKDKIQIVHSEHFLLLLMPAQSNCHSIRDLAADLATPTAPEILSAFQALNPLEYCAIMPYINCQCQDKPYE